MSVVVVSDYASGETVAWDLLRKTLSALAVQDFDEMVEFIYVESKDLEHSLPPDLPSALPSLRRVLSSHSSSYELKNEGVMAASATLVALLDADCVPEPSWLRCLVHTLREHPGAAAVSGRTRYAGSTFVERALAALSRSYIDRGRTAATTHIANNNAVFRRDAFLASPLPTDAGPFASGLQSEAILRLGRCLLFEPAACVTHAFEGWRMERDIRRNLGYAAIMLRKRNASLRYAFLARLGYLSIVVFCLARFVKGSWQGLRFGRHYGLKVYELPGVVCLAMAVTVLEVPGMLRAVQGREIGPSVYR